MITMAFIALVYVCSSSESNYMLPKLGMEEKFEAAIKAHALKFHPAGPYVAGLVKAEIRSFVR